MSGHSASTRARGFSLIEVLAAFVILALVGTVLFRLFGASLNNAGAAEEYSRAAALAESRLAFAAAATDAPLHESSDQGTSDDGRYAWATTVAPYVAQDSTADQTRMGDMASVRLWRIDVVVSWPGTQGSQRSVALSTLRLAPKQP